MTADLRELHARLDRALQKHVEPIFDRQMLVTLVVRHPENAECEVVLTVDDIDEVIAALGRAKARPEMRP